MEFSQSLPLAYEIPKVSYNHLGHYLDWDNYPNVQTHLQEWCFVKLWLVVLVVFSLVAKWHPSDLLTGWKLVCQDCTSVPLSNQVYNYTTSLGA